MDASESSVPVLAVTAAVGAIILLIALVCNTFRRDTSSSGNQDTTDKNEVKKRGGDKGGNKKGKASGRNVKKTSTSTYVPFSHPWLASTLKGHSSFIVAFSFSPNGKYLITASDDRALFLWSVKEFQQKEHKYIRGNVGLDSATQLAFSPDSRAFIASLENGNALRIFRLEKKEDGSSNVVMTGTLTFPKKHKADIIGVGISSNGRFIMSCGGDTTMMIWDLKGEVLSTMDTHQMKISCARMSPCGRFVASSGFTPDVKVWEVCFDKSGTFKEVKRAFELKGHQAGIYSFDFSGDSSRMASVSKDGSWKLWDTDVQYELGQDAKLLFTGKVDLSGPSLIALSPDGRTAAIGADTTVVIWNVITRKQDQLLENVNADSMSCLSFDHSGRYLAVAGGRHIQVIHNMTGYKAAVRDYEDRLKKTSGHSATKERLQLLHKEAQSALDVILSGLNDQAKK